MKIALVLEFDKHLKYIGKNEGTIDNYVKHTLKFIDFLKNKSLQKVTQDDVYKFRIQLEKEYKKATINNIMVALKIFFGYLERNHNMEHNLVFPQYKLDLKNGRDLELITYEEYQKIVEIAGENNDSRFIALAKLMLYTGMRISEALKLNIEDINKDSVKIVGKGNVVRNVYLTHPEVKEALNDYLKARKQPYASVTKKLFVGERGPITRQTAHFFMKKYAKMAGIEENRAHVHVFRHLFCKNCLKSGLSLEDTAALAGHRNVESTKYYLEKEKSEYGDMAAKIKFAN